jgi:Flp pilus assembly protein TadG
VVTRRCAALHGDQRAAAAVEFIIVLVPLLMLFLVIIELTRFGIAGLMVQRAAGIAVRACAVVKDQPLHCDANHGQNGQNLTEQDATITLAAREAMRPLTDSTLTQVSAICKTNVTGNGSGDPQNTLETGTDRVDVVARFHCVVPLARDLVCLHAPQDPPYRYLNASAKHGHQGARYNCRYADDWELAGPNLNFNFLTNVLYGPL